MDCCVQLGVHNSPLSCRPVRKSRLGREPESVDPRAAMAAREGLTDDCLQAWAAWTEIV
jgi:hypothetical protein